MGRPFTITRNATIAADGATIHDLVDDFHEWAKWSPWEDLDPALERTFTGPDRGVGAHYAWRGNRKAGEGSMEITGLAPDAVDIELRFLKPWNATNEVRLALTPSTTGTDVTWTMQGEHVGYMSLLSRVMPLDKMVGKDFEKGLARLKAVAEQTA
jgi:polyketide cyclase/dehydrase/lipid transport protein